tara:strand:+ start:461 stop:877 length:417 start_codon:yes stop_codon:yes gene_type:complete
MADAFDAAWNIAKKDDDYSKFGEKFAERMKQLKEGGRGLPEGTKFSDMRPTTSEKPEMPEGVPINIFDLKNFRPSQTEIDNNAIVDAIMRDIDMTTGGSSAPNPFIPDNIKYPKSLIDRAKKQSGMPQPDIETEEFES